MALGTISKIAGVPDTVVGDQRVHTRAVQLTSGANYTTGGETITPAAVGLTRITRVDAAALALTTSGTTSRSVGFLHQANGSVKVLVHTTASAEATASSDQSTFTVRAAFYGPHTTA